MDTEGEVYVFMGSPEGGKTTQARRLGEKIGGVWIWNEDIMSQLEDPDLLWEVLEAAMSQVSPAQPIVLDGVVTNEADVGDLMFALSRIGRRLVRVICLHIYETESLQRNRLRLGRPSVAAAQVARWKLYRMYALPALDMFRQLKMVSDIEGNGPEDEVEMRITAALASPPDQL
ncbi:MAG TPA: hypothetical protein VGH44_05535 [Candidatus Saccharimonadia bacterium]|jgi:adenylate kinase family enzyme